MADHGLGNSVFVITAAGAAAASNRAKTIDEPVDASVIAEHAPEVAASLEAVGPRLRVWGATPGRFNSPNFQRMQVGDLALLYAGDGRFDALLTVVGKTVNPSLARRLWGESGDGSTWEQISFYADLVPIDLDLERFRQLLGYSDSWTPQGFQYPAEEHQVTLLEKFGGLAGFTMAIAPHATIATRQDPAAAILGGTFNAASPKTPKGRTYRDDLDPDVTARGYLAHEETVAKIAAHAGEGFRRGTPGINHDGAWRADGAFQIVEVKSITGSNEVGQIQKGIGQLLHNRKKAEANGARSVRAHLVLEREPSGPLWAEICEEVGLGLTWPDRFAEDLPT